MMTEDQSGTIAFLTDPATYGLTGPVEVIETHISVVVLAGERAYKLKKALKLPYVDFSTAAIREEACRKEVALNGETAPNLYLGVRRITSAADGSLEWDGDGDPVDCVLEMVRFEQENLFDRIAVSGKLTPGLMSAAARMIAVYHAKAPVVAAGGGADNIAAVLDINDAGFATSRVFDRTALASIGEAFRSRLRRHAALLDRRAAAGKVRRCHGDLHLRNLCLLEGEPRLFDCIEFNAQIATIDVLYDLAFLLMDLWHRGFPELANLTMNRYLDETGDAEGFCLLPFFMAIRAAVRAHVTATQAEEPGQDLSRLTAEAKSYFDMIDVLLQDRPARLIAIGGLSGSGKTAVADRLAARVGAPAGARILESDRIRKALYGVSVETRLPVSAYDPEVSRKVYQEMARHSQLILEQGGCVVADAVFDNPANRKLIEGAAAGADFLGVWLDAVPAILLQRVRSRVGGPSDADASVLEAQLARKPSDISWRHVDASLPLEEVVELICR